MDMTNPIIVALDLRSAADAVDMAESVADHVGGFKIGLGLLHGPGPGTIDALVRLGKPVFAKPLEGGQSPTDFWVRIGNATRQLHGDDMIHYQANHWG